MYITDEWEWGGVGLGELLYFTKAFDYLSHDSLLKFKRYGIRRPLLTFMESFIKSKY